VFTQPQGFTFINGYSIYNPIGVGINALEWSGNTTTNFDVGLTNFVSGSIDGSAYWLSPFISCSIGVETLQVGTTYAQTIAAYSGKHLTNQVAGPSNTNVTLTITGGDFNGQTISLSGQCISYSSPSHTYGPGYSENEVEADETVFALDWGNYQGFKVFLVIDIFMDSEVGYVASDASYPLAQIATTLLGQPSAAAFNASVMPGIIGSLGIQGAAPDMLLFYDFSGSNSVTWEAIVPTNALVPDASGTLVGVYPYINQYDAGVAFPLPRDSHGVLGGAACGPTSLAMGLCTLGFPPPTGPTIPSVYNDTMDPATTNFYWYRAKAWLGGTTSYEHIAFPSLYPAPAGPLYPRLLCDSNSTRFTSDWTTIDSFLAAKHPVLLRTDLTANREPVGQYVPGHGHVICLLGQGHSDYVGAAYGSLYGTAYGSGDYYIVSDPAGHYFANSANNGGLHYTNVEYLRTEGIGVNYGGSLAIYPKTLLQERTCANSTCSYEVMTALLFGATNYAMWQVQSPVTLMVTDPLGNQTGIETNGSVLEQIPDSEYQPDVEDSEDQGQTVVTNGSKTVVVNNPSAGTYRTDMIGTSSGPYTLVFQFVAANGSLGTNFVQTGTVNAGDHLSFQFNVNSTSISSLAPQLTITRSGATITLTWPTNAAGFTLQSTTNLVATAVWTNVSPASVVVNTNNVVTNTISGTQKFYRLSQ
jgi:hypothetical protein